MIFRMRVRESFGPHIKNGIGGAGTFRNRRHGGHCGPVVTATILRLPLSTWGTSGTTIEKIASTWPPMRSISNNLRYFTVPLPPWKPGIGFSNEPSKIGLDARRFLTRNRPKPGGQGSEIPQCSRLFATPVVVLSFGSSIGGADGVPSTGNDSSLPDRKPPCSA
jgi:hypothetical protein